jgi:transposase
MISLPPSVKIFFCVMPVDMRCSFDSLAELVRQYFQAEPESGHLFVFRNKREDCIKVLYWDRDGYALWYKRLEKGTFALPRGQIAGGVEIDPTVLSMMLGGIDFENLKTQRRFAMPASV